MRLIDADAYAAEMRERQDKCKAWRDGLAEGTELYARAEQSLMTFAEAALTLKSQPTIDAIPVEWLEGRLDRAYTLGHEDAAQHYRFVLWAWEREKGADEDG